MLWYRREADVAMAWWVYRCMFGGVNLGDLTEEGQDQLAIAGICVATHDDAARGGDPQKVNSRIGLYNFARGVTSDPKEPALKDA
jgi:hypothetical protein